MSAFGAPGNSIENAGFFHNLAARLTVGPAMGPERPVDARFPGRTLPRRLDSIGAWAKPRRGPAAAGALANLFHQKQVPWTCANAALLPVALTRELGGSLITHRPNPGVRCDGWRSDQQARAADSQLSLRTDDSRSNDRGSRTVAVQQARRSPAHDRPRRPSLPDPCHQGRRC